VAAPARAASPALPLQAPAPRQSYNGYAQMIQPGMTPTRMMQMRTQPGMMQMRMPQPGVQPGMMYRPMVQPGMTQPRMMQPSMMQPRMMPMQSLPAPPRAYISRDAGTIGMTKHLLHVGTNGYLDCSHPLAKPFLMVGSETSSDGQLLKLITVCTFGMRAHVRNSWPHVMIALEWDNDTDFPPALDSSSCSTAIEQVGKMMVTLHMPSELSGGGSAALKVVGEAHAVKLYLSVPADGTLDVRRM